MAMTELRIYLLGPPRIELAQRRIAITRRKSLAILAYLAVTGELQPRDILATLFWSDYGQSRARGALRRELSKLNHLLGANCFEIEGESVGLRQGDNVWLDVSAFQAGMDAGDDPDLLEQVVALYREDFLAGFSLSDSPDFDAWQRFHADSYRQMLTTALDTLCRQYDERGDLAAAIATARRRVVLDPLFEPAHRMLMGLYARIGNQAAALLQYDECVRLLKAEIGAQPDPETVRLAAAIRAGRTSFNADESAALTGNRLGGPLLATAEEEPPPLYNLPSQLTPLVGRTDEIEQLVRLLSAPECRLLTITGAGGMGKTRLAVAVAEQARQVFPAGLGFVALTGVDSPEFLVPALLAALDVPTSSGATKARLFNFLRDKCLLLVLDNFEHLLDAADLLLELLQTAPDLKLVVTSRERINLLGEWVFPLGGLPYPGLESRENHAAYAAVDLFAQRARQTRPDFSLEAEWAGVATICRLVEGMPLGVELAAAWVHIMSCAEIAAEVTWNLDFLSATSRDLPPQHRSLRAVFERSWQLLTHDERGVLAQLAVFRGGFTRGAAQVVTGATPALLARLVDRSLVRRQPSARFDLHELLRQFAAEKLAAMEAHGIEETHGRHCAFYGHHLAQISWQFDPVPHKRRLHEELESHQQVAVELDNVRAAWQWAIAYRDANTIRRMMKSLFFYHERAGTVEEGTKAFDQAIAIFGPDYPASVVSEHAGLLGSLLLRREQLLTVRHDRQAEAYAAIARSLALLQQAEHETPALENQMDMAFAEMEMGYRLSGLGRGRRGIELLAASVARLQALEQWPGMGYALFQWGAAELRWGRIGEAEMVLSRAVELLGPRSETLHLHALFMLANVYNLQGRYQEGKDSLQLVVAGWSQINPHHNLFAFALRNFGDLLAAVGEFARAEQCFADAGVLFQRHNMEWQVALALVWNPGVIARLQGDLSTAERCLTAYLATARRVGFQSRVVINLHNLAALRCDQGRYEEAQLLLEEALAIARRIDFRSGLAMILCRIGYTAIDQHRTEAHHYLREALEIAQNERMDRVALAALVGVARYLVSLEKRRHAAGLVTFVAAHPAADYETRRHALRLQVELTDLGPPAESAPPFATDDVAQWRAELHAVVEDLLKGDLLANPERAALPD